MDAANFYKGFSFDYVSKILELHIEKPETDVTLFEIWDHEFRHFNEFNVCLSGGIDSQFSLSILKNLGKTAHVYIFAFTWEDCVFNSHDVVHAIRYCKRFNHKYTVIDIDYKQFLHTNQHLKTCQTYKAISPQIAWQLKMLDSIENKTIPTLVGGDVPIIMLDRKTNIASLLGASTQPFMTNSFLRYSIENKCIVIKDLFRINPVTHYLGYKQFLETTKKHRIALSNDNNFIGQSQPFRKVMYEDLGADLLAPLLKQTGFETLKAHLAKLSGVYNQYDILYRYPLEKTLAQENWFDKDNFKVTVPNLKPLKDIQQEYELFCKENNDITYIEQYHFLL